MLATILHSPRANAKHEYGVKVVNELSAEKFDAAIAAVAHK